MGDKLDDILASVGESPEVLREKAERTPECPDVSTFSRFVGGELRGRERKRVLRHVVDCHFCMAAWKSVESYGPSPAVAKPRRQTLARRPARLARSWGFWAPGGAMAAAAVVALVFLVTPDPGAHMEGYLYTGNTVRDSSAGLLRNGATVYPRKPRLAADRRQQNRFCLALPLGARRGNVPAPAHRGGQGPELRLPRTWEQGRAQRFPFRTRRIWCPCAVSALLQTQPRTGFVLRSPGRDHRAGHDSPTGGGQAHKTLSGGERVVLFRCRLRPVEHRRIWP